MQILVVHLRRVMRMLVMERSIMVGQLVVTLVMIVKIKQMVVGMQILVVYLRRVVRMLVMTRKLMVG